MYSSRNDLGERGVGVGRGDLNDGGGVRFREERSISLWELKRMIPATMSA